MLRKCWTSISNSSYVVCFSFTTYDNPNPTLMIKQFLRYNASNKKREIWIFHLTFFPRVFALNVNMIYLIYAWPNELEKREFAIRSLGNIGWFKHTFNKIRTTIYISIFEFFGNWQLTIWIEYIMKIWICKNIWRLFYKSLYKSIHS